METFDKLLSTLLKIQKGRKNEGSIGNAQNFRNVILAMSRAGLIQKSWWGEDDIVGVPSVYWVRTGYGQVDTGLMRFIDR